MGPVALAAKASLLHLILATRPSDTPSKGLYGMILEHGDFGIHNTTVETDGDGWTEVTSLTDCETGCITLALLSDPWVAVLPVDLVGDELGVPADTRIPKDATLEDLRAYSGCAHRYIEGLCFQAWSWGSP